MDSADAPSVAQAVSALLSGEVVGLPTETVYGLAADGTNAEAVGRIFSVKGRPAGHPLILHLGEASWLGRYAEHVPDAAKVLAEAFWPGPLTLVLQRSETVPDAVTGGLDTVALRVPAHRLAREVILELGRPVAAPSANRFGAVSPTTRAHVLRDLGDAVPLVLEGGACDIGLESTIVDLTRGMPRLLRPGAITQEQLEQTLGVKLLSDDGTGPAAPGTLESHYAPRARVTIVEPEQLSTHLALLNANGRVVGVICGADEADVIGEHEQKFVMRDAAQAAHDLYEALRRLDEWGCEEILTTLPPPEGIGVAVADRVRRAAAPRPAGDK